MTPALVGRDERARLGIHPAGELLLEQVAPELIDFVDRPAAPRPTEYRDDGVVVGLTEHETNARQQRVPELVGRDVAASESSGLERERREAVDERAVEVEERTDLGTAGTPVDFVDERVHPRDVTEPGD